LLAAWPTYRLAVSRSATAASASPMIRSIAVLPLDNLAGDASQEYFADGMTDELITMLAKYKSLRVISCTSVMQYKKTRKSLPEIARELSVDGIAEGSISRSQEKLRVTAQLAYGPTDTHLWSGKLQPRVKRRTAAAARSGKGHRGASECSFGRSCHQRSRPCREHRGTRCVLPWEI
jgi:TolB-like protein